MPTTRHYEARNESPSVYGDCENRPVIERRIEVMTNDGEMPTFVFHPTHDGPHPVVLYLMDAPSIRPALKDMATRLSSAGYYVMLPYLYYRGGPFREFGRSDEDMHARQELMATVSPANIVIDAEALLAVAADDPAAAAGDVGTVGFCMSGGLAIALARAFPERIAAAASIHGAWIVRDTPDSPHQGLKPVRAEVYMAWVHDDPTAPPEHIAVMREALEEAGVRHTIDVITGAVHGFAPPGERYDRDASELHWERVHSLLRRNIG
jgi:carboxymethylenebutenolidase